MLQVRRNDNTQVLVVYADDTPDAMVINLSTDKVESILESIPRDVIEADYPELVDDSPDIRKVLKY